ncbi:MAG: hypothetical protein Alis3KO_20250 [Aliiglaciecola sp.]
MKIIVSVTLLILSTISFQTLSASSSIIDKLNINISKCYQQTEKGKYAKKRACNTVLKSDFISRKNRAIAYHNRGVINLSQGDINSAFRDFRRAIKYDPTMSKTKQIVAYLNTKMSNQVG